MDTHTPRARSSPRLPPPPPLLLSAAASPSHDLPFTFVASASSSPFGAHLHPLSMYRAPVGRVGSDLSHNSSFSKPKATVCHPTAARKDDGDKAKKTSPFFSSLGGVWRKQDTAAADRKKPAEERRKDNKTKRATVDLGQWVKKRMTAMVDHLRSSFYDYRHHQAQREQRRRPHSFSGHGPMNSKERERWTTRRRGQQHLSSAPASLRVSPANSGHLSVKAAVSSASEEDRTMEELQSAIDAAIAHCKNSMSRARADDDGRQDKLQHVL